MEASKLRSPLNELSREDLEAQILLDRMSFQTCYSFFQGVADGIEEEMLHDRLNSAVLAVEGSMQAKPAKMGARWLMSMQTLVRKINEFMHNPTQELKTQVEDLLELLT